MGLISKPGFYLARSLTKKILFCRESLWEDDVQLSTRRYAGEFENDGWDVFWLTRPLNPLSFFNPRWAAAKKTKFDLWRSGGRDVSENSVSYSPITLLPYRNSWPFDSIWAASSSLKLTIPRLSSVLRRHKFESPDILWLSDLSQVSILDIIEPKFTVFHVTDDYSAYPRAPKSVPEVERSASLKADLVLVTHPLLEDKFTPTSDSVRYLPHGVDSSRFEIDYPEPDDMTDIPEPRVIYVGSLAEWIDWDLLATVTGSTPDISYVLIGPRTAVSKSATEALEELNVQPNVYWLGPKRNVVPYLRHSDVGIIPFQRGRREKYSNPMKMYEYISAGLPIVSTWPAWDEVGTSTQIPLVATEEGEEFTGALISQVEASRHKRANNVEEGRRFAVNNSWTARFENALGLISEVSQAS